MGGGGGRILCVRLVFTIHLQYISTHQSYTYTLIAKPTQYDTGDQNIGKSISWITAGCDLLHAGRHKIHPVGMPAFPALWGTLTIPSVRLTCIACFLPISQSILNRF